MTKNIIKIVLLLIAIASLLWLTFPIWTPVALVMGAYLGVFCVHLGIVAVYLGVIALVTCWIWVPVLVVYLIYKLKKTISDCRKS